MSVVQDKPGMSPDQIREKTYSSVRQASIVDVHTHLYPVCCDRLLLRGIDDLLTYHYLIVETLRYGQYDPCAFLSLPRQEQASIIWRTLFVQHSPVSEACRGVITALKQYGLDPYVHSLEDMRGYFRSMSLEDHVDMVFKKARIDYVVMTNDAFDGEETVKWGTDFRSDRRFRAALRIDALLNSPKQAMEALANRGYDVGPDLSRTCISECIRFLQDSSDAIRPIYLAASMPPTFRWNDGSAGDRVLHEVVLPFCKANGLPLALMIGVNKRANPAMGLGGDSLGKSAVDSLERMCCDNPDIRFLVTMLSRENQHELCVAARKFPNLMIFGCWWFLNIPSIVMEITTMRLELLGLSFIPQHSDARVLDQLLYKWDHSKDIIADALAQKYLGISRAGWSITPEDIDRDVAQLFSGNADWFLGAGRG